MKCLRIKNKKVKKNLNKNNYRKQIIVKKVYKLLKIIKIRKKYCLQFFKPKRTKKNIQKKAIKTFF